MDNLKTVTYADFAKLDIRIGTVLTARPVTGARKPAYELHIDFGDLGIKKSSAQITSLYEAEQLMGKQVVAVVNFPLKQIAHLMSECLVLGACDGPEVVLLQPERPVKNGLRIA